MPSPLPAHADVRPAPSRPRIPPAAPTPPAAQDAMISTSTTVTTSTSAASTAVAGTAPHRPDQWLFDDWEIAHSPSAAAGLPPAEERARRAKGVNFIVQAGILLKLPQVTLGTASVFFQRFYMRMGMVVERGGLHHYNIAATALFLATKTEENCRKTKEIVIAVAKVAQKNAHLVIDESSKEFWRWKDSILLYEETMLELLTFDVVLDSPYTHLYHVLRRLNIDDNKDLRNVAWAFLNDSQMTTAALRMPARDLAVAAVYFAARYTRAQIPDPQDAVPWWRAVGGAEHNIVKAVSILQEFYLENPLGRADNPHEGSPAGSIEDLEATRGRPTPRSPEAGATGSTVALEPEGGVGEVRREAEPRESIEVDQGMRGDDDAVLKRVANDPATHEVPGAAEVPRRVVEVVEGGGKRKESESEEGGREAKRVRGEEEESEEGEVEE